MSLRVEQSQYDQTLMFRPGMAGSIHHVPSDVLTLIFSLLGSADLLRQAFVSQRFRYLSSQDILWKKFVAGLKLSVVPNLSMKSLILRKISTDFHAILDGEKEITDATIERALPGITPLLTRVVIQVNLPRKCSITGAALSLIAKQCPDITTFKLETTDPRPFLQITDNAIAGFTLRVSRSIREVAIKGCPQVTDRGLHVLTQSCPRLQQVAVQNDSFTDAFVVSLAMAHPGMRRLELSGNTKGVSDESLDAVKAHLKSLQALDIRIYSRPFSKKEARNLLSSLPHVTSFTFNGCSRVSDTFVKAVTLSLKDLRDLYLGGCTKVTKQSIQYLAEKCRALSSLVLLDCQKPEQLQKELATRRTAFPNLTYDHIAAPI